MRLVRSVSYALCILASVTHPASSFDDRRDDASKRQLVKEDIERMMVTLSNWDRWGKDDELGALNLITPEKRKQAAALVREGVSVSFARDVIKDGAETPAGFTHTMVQTGLSEMEVGSAGDEYRIRYHGFTLTHMDALCHLFYKGKMYNGFSQKDVNEKGAGKLSVLKIKQGVFTRGILMDMPKHFGVEFLKGGQAIYPE
ncbi:MAG: hypothetical protein AB7O26_21230, partial [Planctomycetaceae bacterium]